MNRNVFILLIAFATVACSHYTTYTAEIEQVLKLAGNNRKELEKVLEHYRRHPGDSLKLRAAEFLIVNMPGRYSEYYNAPWNDVATVHLRWTSSPNKKLVLDTYRLGKQVRHEDVKHITAEYLINNIELAFKVWQETPWGKHIPFDAFCEEILPYRVSTEPLENWREKALASFADLYTSFINDTTGITAVEACNKINDVLPRFRMDKDFPSMSYSQLMASTRGLCDHMATLAIFAMRGLGIPVTFEFTKMLPYYDRGHSWNSVRDSSGVHHSFMGAETNTGISHLGTTLFKAKTYRKMYAKQHNVTLEQKDIPPLLRNINYIIDVTSEYDYCRDIWFPGQNRHLSQTGYVFLAILNEMKWYPVAWGVDDNGWLRFSSVKRGLYLPVYYHNGVQTPAGYPFRFAYNSCRFFHSSSIRTRTLTSIGPGDYVWCHKMDGGKFEVANQSDFSDAETIHTIDRANSCYLTASIKHAKACRYIRYVSPKGGRCHVSELEFYNENNEKLQGTVMGETDAHTNVFDGDVDTFFEAESDDSWIGLDLGKLRRISKIRYLPRTTGYGIYEGHTYELLYWNGDKWRSLGRQKATSNILQYNVPDFALFYIKNITKNRMYTTPFIIESGTQHWF